MQMSEHAPHIVALLDGALRAAAEAAQERLGRSLAIVDATEPTSTALLRFDLRFGEGESLVWLVSNEDATGFSDLLIGGVGDRGAVLTEMHLDALSGTFGDMLDRAVIGLNSTLSEPLGGGEIDMGMESELPAVEDGGVRTTKAFEIDGFGSLTLVLQCSAQLAGRLTVLGGTAMAPAAPAVEAAAPQPVAEAAAPVEETPAAAAEPMEYDNVVQLPTDRTSGGGQGDLRMLLNVPLNVTVELGQTSRSVRELLELSVGSILELDKLAGDPMDILVNGKVLAKGEVVVIDEEFGIRITEILSPEQRLRNIG
jgi:flagellar motor switch protein FliN/FliY